MSPLLEISPLMVVPAPIRLLPVADEDEDTISLSDLDFELNIGLDFKFI
jgi:hypothetical protein